MAKKFLTGLTLVNLPSDPSVGSEGELYFNSSASVAKIYKQGAWSELGAGGGSETTVSTTEPVSPAIGDAWYKNDTGEFYIYDGTYWVEVNGVVSLSQEQVQDYVSPLFIHSNHTNVSATYDDANNEIILNTSASITNIDSIVYPDYIVFDTTPENTSASTGTIYWDNGDSVLKTILNANVELGIGQESVALVKNTTGSTIPKGRVVYIDGAAGQRPTIDLSDADAETSSTKTFGITAEAIDDEQEGFVVTEGILRGVNTDGLTEGGAIWLSSSAGYFTQMHPVQPQHGVFLGYVVKAHPSSGEIFVKIQNGYELEELHNVLINNPLDNQALVYNSSASLWYNESIVNSLEGTANEIDISASVGNITLSFPNDLITPGNLTVTGNLTVSGSTTYINTETLNIEDNIILLNSNVTGVPTGTSGIEVERGDEANSSILWDESTETWTFSNDIKTYAIRSENILQLDVSASVGSSGEIDLMTDFAELNINTDGSIDLRPGDVSGFEMYKFTKTNLQFPDLSQQNTAFLGMSSYDTDDLNEGTTNLYFTNQRAVDALNSTLTNYLTQSSASSTYLTQADASSTYLTQASASSTYLTTETDPVFVASDAYQITSASTAAWNESYSWGDHSSAGYSLTSHNHSLDSLSNVEISSIADGESIVWNSASSKWINQIAEGGASVTISPTAPVSPLEGDMWFDSDTLELFIFDSLYWIEVSGGAVDLSSYLTIASASSTYLTQASASTTYLTSESDTFETVTDRGATSSNAITISNTTEATNATTGALIVSGGVGVAKDLWIDGNLHVAGTTTTENTKTVATHDNLIYLNAALDSTITDAVYSSGSITYTAENLYTAGMDIRITGVDPAGFNIATGDNLTVASATPTYFVVVKADPGALYVSGGTAHAKEEANPDLGFAGGYYSGGYAHAGLFRDASDGIFKFFDGYTPEPDEAVNIDTGDVSFSFAPIKSESLEVVDASTTRTNLGLAIGTDVQAYNSTLAAVAGGTYTGDDSITTVGTISSGTWNGTTVDYPYGGTGLTTLGTAGQVLTVNSGATAIEWATPSGGGGGGLTTTTTSITVNTATAIESFAIATSRTAEAIIQITQGTDYYSSKVLLIHDDTNVKITEYAILESTVGAIPLTISAAISGSNLELLATITDAATTNATAKVILIEVAV